MAKSAIITLTTAGTDTGPFNLLSDVDSYVSPFESNIAKSSLVAGYTTNLVPDAATIVRVQSSSSLCTNYIDLVYPGQTTTTTTTTSTTTTTTTTEPTTTTSTTTTTTTVLCECWTVVNEDVVTINYTVTNCDGTTISPNLIAGGTRKHCIQAGSSFIVNSPIGGLLGEYNCAQACSGSPTECPDCTPTTTSTTTTTTTTAPTTSTSTTTTTTNPSASLYVSNTSLDIPITDVTVNGVSVTFVSGVDFTIPAGDNGNFETNQIGTYDIVVYYGGHISGQNITITDSNSNIFCCNLNGSAGSCTFTGAVINTSQTVQIVASDGACA